MTGTAQRLRSDRRLSCSASEQLCIARFCSLRRSPLLFSSHCTLRSFTLVSTSGMTAILTSTNDKHSAFHLPRRLQLHLRRDSRNLRRNYRTLFPGHHHWPLHFSGSRAIDLLLGEEGDGEDGRTRAFQDRARVPSVVLHAWRLHRHSRQPVLDGVDFSPRYFNLESAGCKCLVWLRHFVYLHHKVWCKHTNRFMNNN